MTTPYVISKPHKSTGIAIILTFLLGPLGLLYASISGALIMIFLPILLALLTIIGLLQKNVLLTAWSGLLLLAFCLFYWLICMIWAVVSVRNYNQKIDAETNQQVNLLIRLQETERSQINLTINQNTSSPSTPSRKIELTTKPNLQEWLKNNPGKTVNEYFSKFGK